MLKLLFIEDDQGAIEPVLKLMEAKKNVCCEVSEFETAEGRIASFLPDIVILDLLVGGASPGVGEPEGLETHKFIWNQHFCPIVVYSALPKIYDDACESHPFVKSIKKGRDSPQKVLDAVCQLLPHVDALKEAESHIRHSFSCAMRDVAPYAFEAFTDIDKRMETIKRSGRRRLAALMDELSLDGTTLASWEQYLCPPVCADIQLGDILREFDAADDDPASFRVVLTPSCDLVASGNRKSKVCNILVAKCCSIQEGLELINLKGSPKKLEDRLPSGILSQGYSQAVIPFPCLERKVPTMAANLKDLELIPIRNVGLNERFTFIRVASVDSPFRELVAWAYMQTAGRPSLPDRDFASWAKEITATLKSERSEKKNESL